MKNKVLFFYFFGGLMFLFLGACQKDPSPLPEPEPEPKPDSAVIIITFSPLPENVSGLLTGRCLIYDKETGYGITAPVNQRAVVPPQYIWGIEREVMKEYKNKPVVFYFSSCKISNPYISACFSLEKDTIITLKPLPQVNEVYIYIPPISY